MPAAKNRVAEKNSRICPARWRRFMADSHLFLFVAMLKMFNLAAPFGFQLA
jgi:hypothetical protein